MFDFLLLALFRMDKRWTSQALILILCFCNFQIFFSQLRRNSWAFFFSSILLFYFFFLNPSASKTISIFKWLYCKSRLLFPLQLSVSHSGSRQKHWVNCESYVPASPLSFNTPCNIKPRCVTTAPSLPRILCCQDNSPVWLISCSRYICWSIRGVWGIFRWLPHCFSQYYGKLQL